MTLLKMEGKISLLVCFLLLLPLKGERHRCCILNRHADCSFRDLHTVPQLPANTVSLNLKGNEIETLKNYSFKHLPNLRILILERNKISAIQEYAFKGLKNLKKLTLSKNRLQVTGEHFKRPIFKSTPMLTLLDLSENVNIVKYKNIDTYPDKNLGHLLNLRTLKIDLYPKPAFGPGFRKLSKLETLEFRKCFVQTLTNNTFRYIKNITCLSMRNCGLFGSEYSLQIPTMEPGVFQHFRFLRSLDLSNSAFTLPVVMESLHTFQNREMEVLNLYNVNPASLLWMNDKDYFVSLTKHMARFYIKLCVHHINLGKNGIANVQAGALFAMNNYTCLRSYILSENNFMLSFPNMAWDLLKFASKSINLKVFDFSYMLIQTPSVDPFPSRYIPSGCGNKMITQEDKVLPPSVLNPSRYKSSGVNLTITCPPSLKVVRFSYVVIPFNVEDTTVFKNCSGLDLVDLSSNPLNQFDFGLIGIEDTKTVKLSGLDCTQMEKVFMNSFRNVQNLILQNGNLDRAFVKGNFFLDELCKMKTLDISFNHLSELHPKSLCFSNHLRAINLSSNSFDKFPSVLKHFEKLDYINLCFNRISEINASLTTWLDEQYRTGHNIHLLLKGNIFLCICDNIKFIQWVYETPIALPDKDSYLCVLQDGSRLKMKLVYQNLNKYFGKCKTEILLKFGIFGVSLLGLVLVASVIVYRFRWRILYFFYRQCRAASPPNGNMFYFDAFVAYTGEDYKWVWGELRPKLEDKYNLKICLHDREFILGESIAQNIVDFLRKSRKIVFDLTPGYLKAKWCTFELEMARMEMFQRGTPDAVIVIIRGGVDPETMPRCIREIWKNVTCVILPEDEHDAQADDVFWSRLYDAIVN